LVKLIPSDLTLWFCDQLHLSTYSFRCPRCTKPASRLADRQVVRILQDCGVQTKTWYLPQEMLEPRPDGPAFDDIDVAAFVMMLQKPHWLEEMVHALAQTIKPSKRQPKSK
jgi:hypothetical protein